MNRFERDFTIELNKRRRQISPLVQHRRQLIYPLVAFYRKVIKEHCTCVSHLYSIFAMNVSLLSLYNQILQNVIYSQLD